MIRRKLLDRPSWWHGGACPRPRPSAVLFDLAWSWHGAQSLFEFFFLCQTRNQPSQQKNCSVHKRVNCLETSVITGSTLLMEMSIVESSSPKSWVVQLNLNQMRQPTINRLACRLSLCKLKTERIHKIITTVWFLKTNLCSTLVNLCWCDREI